MFIFKQIADFINFHREMNKLREQLKLIQEENKRLKDDLESLQELRESLERMYTDECDQHVALKISCGIDTEPEIKYTSDNIL